MYIDITTLRPHNHITVDSSLTTATHTFTQLDLIYMIKSISYEKFVSIYRNASIP